MALLLACACSRDPGAPGGAARKAGAETPAPLAAADAHLARGEEAREREEYSRAREEAEKARALFERDQNWEGYVRARNLIGAAVARQGDYKGALDHLNSARATAQEKLGPRHPEVARSDYEIATIYVATGRSKEGLELLQKALVLRRAAGGPRTKEVSEILMRMGVAHSDQGEGDRALVFLAEAEAIDRALPARPGLTDALIGKGAALWGLGRYEQSIEVLEQAVGILEAARGKRVSLAAAYANLGSAYWSKSDYDEALTYYEKALPLLATARGGAHPNVGLIHFNVATLHLMKREYDACIASAEEALKILVPALGERNSEVVQTYNVLGSALTRKGDPDRGLGFLKNALAIQRSLPEKGSRDSALIQSSLADAYRAKGDLSRADRAFREALAIDVSIYGQRHPDVAEDFVNLGDLYLEKGDAAEALRFFAKAIAANDPNLTRSDPDLDPPFDTAFSNEFLLKALKGAARARGAAKPTGLRELQAAARVYEHASRLIDRMRAGYRAEGSKLSIAASATETYDEAIRTEIELHRLTGEERYLERAFRYAEKSKVGILRDALNEAEARSFSGIPQGLIDRERQLRIELTEADQGLTDAQLEKDVPESRLQPLRDRQFGLKREYEALQQRFEKEHPSYYDLKYRFETTGPMELRERALEGGTVLVEYFMGRDRIFIFTITAQDLAVATVARVASLESELQELRRSIVEGDQASYGRSAHPLYARLLAPVEARFAGRALLIIPDGPLSTVPFEALLTREVSPDTPPHALPYLLRDHAISYAYSATLALEGLRRRRSEPPDDFVGFAPASTPGTAVDALPSLPASRKEVTDIRDLFAKRQGILGDWFSPRSRVYLGRDATNARLKSAGLDRYRYVHLATHGIVDEEHPNRSRLLLAPEPGSAEDGVLRLGEAYNLHLNADLVVLSACDTGRGRIAQGEGIIGLTRGFLYAGARSLLVSFWPVSDAAASDLVVDFYRELLGGRAKAEALREAKLRTMSRNPEYAKPYYWAPFILVGP